MGNAGQGNRRKWVLNDRAEEFESPKHFYVFVALGEQNKRPRFHIVPSTVVAERTRKSHQKWLMTPGKKGQQHRDTPMRRFSDLDDDFLEKWELLGLG